MNHGISTLQGPHQVAQKSSRMTLPLKSDSFTSLFVTSLSTKSSGAGFAFAGHAAPSFWANSTAFTASHGISALNTVHASAHAATVAAIHRNCIRALLWPV